MYLFSIHSHSHALLIHGLAHSFPHSFSDLPAHRSASPLAHPLTLHFFIHSHVPSLVCAQPCTGSKAGTKEPIDDLPVCPSIFLGRNYFSNTNTLDVLTFQDVGEINRYLAVLLNVPSVQGTIFEIYATAPHYLCFSGASSSAP